MANLLRQNNFAGLADSFPFTEQIGLKLARNTALSPTDASQAERFAPSPIRHIGIEAPHAIQSYGVEGRK